MMQYMMDFNHWYNPKSPKALAMRKARRGQGRTLHVRDLLCLQLDQAAMRTRSSVPGHPTRRRSSPHCEASTWADHFMPYGPTKFVNGQNTGGRAALLQATQGRHRRDLAGRIRVDQGDLPAPEAQLSPAGLPRCGQAGAAFNRTRQRCRTRPRGRCPARRLIRGFIDHRRGRDQRSAARRHLHARRLRSDADLRRSAHHQFRPRQHADAVHVRRLLPADPVRHRPLPVAADHGAGHVPVRLFHLQGTDRTSRARQGREHSSDHAGAVDLDRESGADVLPG